MHPKLHGTKLIALVLGSFALTLLHASVIRADTTTIRVGLLRHLRGAKQITVLASSDYGVFRTGTEDRIASSTNLAPITLKAGEKEIELERDTGASAGVGQSVTVTPADSSGTISVDSPARPSKQYHGTLEVTLNSGALQIVNVVDLEDYLPGVLAGEMPSSYPAEALKAQAIAARTYTLDNRKRHQELAFDVCDDTHCQVYDGTLREKPSCMRAISDTNGLVLIYKGQLASPMYCADCGGSTQDYSEIFPSKSLPYLRGVTEPGDVTHNCWKESYTLQALSDALTKAGVKEAAGLRKMEVSKVSSSGRALSVTITGANGATTIAGNKLRTILGRDKIKSTLFTLESASDTGITITGKGFGHGIGMCQVGAKGLAGPPHDFTCAQILEYYYPGTGVLPLDGASRVASATAKAPQSSSSPKARKPDAAAAPPRGAGPPPKKETEKADFEVRVKAPAL